MPYEPRVYVSQVIEAPVEDVWSAIRAFDELEDWHPAITDCTIEADQPPDRVGVVRNFYADGDNIRERLVTLSDADTCYRYTMIESPMPVIDYQSELRLIPVTEGRRTLAKWTARFDAEEGRLDEMVDQVTGIFSAGLNALRDQFQ